MLQKDARLANNLRSTLVRLHLFVLAHADQEDLLPFEKLENHHGIEKRYFILSVL